VKEPATRGKTFTLLPHSLPRRLVDPVALAVARTGLTPNAVTALGLAGSLGAAALVAGGYFLLGGLLVLAAAALDLLDGHTRDQSIPSAASRCHPGPLGKCGARRVFHFSEGAPTGCWLTSPSSGPSRELCAGAGRRA
jgi:hypothetical protein